VAQPISVDTMPNSHGSVIGGLRLPVYLYYYLTITVLPIFKI